MLFLPLAPACAQISEPSIPVSLAHPSPELAKYEDAMTTEWLGVMFANMAFDCGIRDKQWDSIIADQVTLNSKSELRNFLLTKADLAQGGALESYFANVAPGQTLANNEAEVCTALDSGNEPEMQMLDSIVTKFENH
jgi:hypothetical protein